MFVYMIQPVVKPVWQQVVSSKGALTCKDNVSPSQWGRPIFVNLGSVIIVTDLVFRMTKSLSLPQGLQMPKPVYGTEWPIMCWCAVKKLLTHSLPNRFGGSLNYANRRLVHCCRHACSSFLWSPYVIGQTIIFACCGLFFFFFFFFLA